MTAEISRDVIENLMHNRPASRMGTRDPIWPQTLAKWVAEGYPTNAEGRPVDPVIHFGQDWADVGGGFDLMPLRGVRDVVEETDEWEVVRDGSGAELKNWKFKAGTPEHIRFHMTSRKVWDDDYRCHLTEFDSQRLRIESTTKALAQRRREGKWTFFGTMFLFEHMRHCMGDICLYESFLDDPAWIDDYGTVLTDFFIRHWAATFEQAGKPEGVRICEDLGYKGRLLCSPTSLAERIFPHYKRLVDFLHSQGLIVLLHSCGMVEEALPLILEAGFDGLDPMERAAGCDPIRFGELTGGKLVLSGGFDKRTLESGDRVAIRREAVALLDAMRKNRFRYVFSTDHSVSTNVAYRDYQYLMEVVHDNLAY